jgi:hypothetical protein
VRCRECNRNKKAHLYYKRHLDQKRPICKSCFKKTPAYRQRISTYLLREYGITLDEYDTILEKQDGRCYICSKLPGQRRLAVDHDHALEKKVGTRESVRGLLCQRCNEYLGHIADNPVSAGAMYDYLNEGHGPWLQELLQ